MSQNQLAIELLENGNLSEAISILTTLTKQPNPPKHTYLVLAATVEGSPFKFLSYTAAKKEYELHNSAEAVTLITNLQNQSRQGRNKPIHSLPKVSLIGILTDENLKEWLQCFESIKFQHYVNVELCLAFSSPNKAELPADIKIIQYSGSHLDAYEAAINASSGEIISIIECPSSIFSDSGLGAVATSFYSNPNLNVLQTERLYASALGFPQAMRHNFPHWDQKNLLNKSNLLEPTRHFSWLGVFFRRSLIQEFLPFNRSFIDASAFEVATRIARSHIINTARFAVVLSEIPISHKSPLIPLKQIGESIVIMDREKKLFPSQNQQPNLLEPANERNDLLKYISPDIILKGQEANLKISIVTASYNCADYIEECIDSILNQNYKNLEFIILDGASTDGTKQKILRYEKYLSYFLSAPDAGHYSAIQTGLNLSTGQILTWLNADDMLCPYSLSLVSHIFSSQKQINWITGNQANIDESKLLNINQSALVYSPSLYLEGEFDTPFIQQEGTFWTRKLWEKAGSTLDLRLSLAADMELWTRFFQHEPLYSLNIPLGIFRKRPDQRSALFRQEYYCEAVSTINKLKLNQAKPVDVSDKQLLIEI
jgi:hypothetical protein